MTGSGRTFVFGDLHGCVEELDVVLDAVGPTASDTLCFLGDYVDRGPSPRAVVDRLLQLGSTGCRTVFLKGNHEDMFLAYLGLPGRYGDAFLANGGRSTLRSYGINGLAGPSAAERLPEDHLRFFLRLELRLDLGEFYCVHAGLDPLRPLDEQHEEDLLWIREDFILACHDFPFTILFGHTPQREVFVHLPYKIGLDTGLVYGNKLSVLELRDRTIYQVRRGNRRVLRSELTERMDSMGAA